MVEFFATLSLENLDKIAEMIQKKLEGKKYVFVAANELFRFQPEVRPDQEIRPNVDGKLMSVWKKDGMGGLTVCDTYGVWGLSTEKTDREYDPTFNSPYVVFEGRQIKMTLRAPAGHLLYWTIAVQNV